MEKVHKLYDIFALVNSYVDPEVVIFNDSQVSKKPLIQRKESFMVCT